jgi:hypothetical protein
MEVITIDSKAYRDLIEKIDRIANYVAKKEGDRECPDHEVWLDSFQVANLLQISTKTLQRLRKDKLISYSQLRGRCLYKLSEIERALNERLISCDPQTIDEFRKNYLLEHGFK